MPEFALNTDPQQRAYAWLQQQGVHADRLTPLSGYTNHVFLVEQSAALYPQRSVLRLADYSRSADLCPLAHQFDAVLQRHVDAAELGLAPEVITADQEAGVMWVQYAGKRTSLRAGDFAEIRALLDALYDSDLQWLGGQSVTLQRLLAELLQQLCSLAESNVPGEAPAIERGSEISEVMQSLLQQAEQRGYFDYPVVPIHGDLNPDNLLHDGQRWWLIDWDFSGMQLREWDLAGFIVGHDLNIEQASKFLPAVGRADMQWFCRCFAILNWYWHVKRGSEQNIISTKVDTMQYWIVLKG